MSDTSGHSLRLHHCPECRYDLSGLPRAHACPECGFDYDEATFDLTTRANYTLSSVWDVLPWLAIPAVVVFDVNWFGVAPFSGATWLRIVLVFAIAQAAASYFKRRRRQRLGGDVVFWFHREGLSWEQGLGGVQTYPWRQIAAVRVSRVMPWLTGWPWRRSEGARADEHLWRLEFTQQRVSFHLESTIPVTLVGLSRREAARVRTAVRRWIKTS